MAPGDISGPRHRNGIDVEDIPLREPKTQSPGGAVLDL
jgi:hypothetical protein